MSLKRTLLNRLYLLGVVFFGSRGKAALAYVGARAAR